jgi:hypothetical protein
MGKQSFHERFRVEEEKTGNSLVLSQVNSWKRTRLGKRMTSVISQVKGWKMTRVGTHLSSVR